jgi:hypothetical protein
MAVTAAAQAPAPTVPSPAADSAFFASDWALAKSRYDAFIAANPTVLVARVKAGFATLRLGRDGEAIRYFSHVIDQTPSGQAPFALAGLAMASAHQGDQAKALEYLERAVAAGYGNFAALDTEASLSSLRADPRFVAVRTRAEQNQMPCLADPNSRAFDFWLGEWDVYINGTTQLAGRSRIDRVSGGCVILENWTRNVTPIGAPFEGKSLNFYEQSTGKWKQVWAGSGRDVGYFDNGEYRDGAMRFVFKQTTRQGQPVEGRFTFYNLGPNRVRQFNEQSTDGGKTYQTVYDFIYVRKGSGERPLTLPTQ